MEWYRFYKDNFVLIYIAYFILAVTTGIVLAYTIAFIDNNIVAAYNVKRRIRYVVEAENGMPFRHNFKVTHHYFATIRRARRWAKSFIRQHPYGLVNIFYTNTHFKWRKTRAEIEDLSK
jgi:hypothetical protein